MRPQHAARQPPGLSRNTTRHLLADMEKLRAHLGVDRWLICGASWGCTLTLAYAQLHPGRVTQIVLSAVATTRRSWLEEGALLRGASRLDGIPGVLIHGRLDLTCPLGTAWALAGGWPAPG